MTRQRLTRIAALGLALAALAAPASYAQQDLRNPDQVSPAVAEQQDLRSPDAIDAAVPERPDVVVVEAPTPAAPDDGLDWADAGIGAGGLLALCLIALGGTLLVVHRRHAMS